MTVFRESLCLLGEVHGGFGGCQGKAPFVCFMKCIAVLADVSVCNLHMLRPTSETQNCEKNKCGAQSGGKERKVEIVATAHALWRIWQCGR